MLTRRFGLLASALMIGAGPSFAQKRSPSHTGGRSRKGQADAEGSPAETPVGTVGTSAKWAYIQDFETGATLLEKQADEEMPPSSMTKLMTMYIVYDQLKQGRLYGLLHRGR